MSAITTTTTITNLPQSAQILILISKDEVEAGKIIMIDPASAIEIKDKFI